MAFHASHHGLDMREFSDGNHMVSPTSDDSNHANQPHHENFHANIEMPHEEKGHSMAEKHRLSQEELEL